QSLCAQPCLRGRLTSTARMDVISKEPNAKRQQRASFPRVGCTRMIPIQASSLPDRRGKGAATQQTHPPPPGQGGAWMRFYTQQPRFYCGVDLHAKRMYICILNTDGEIVHHQNGPANPQHFLRAVAPYRDDLVVAVECMFTWYWLADLCAREHIAFVLGHALYMKAIHGGKAKNDKIDAHKIAALLRGGLIPQAYVYPPEMRATRDLLRRRCHFMRKRAELLANIQNPTSQYNLPPLGKKIAYKANRPGVAEHFVEAEVRKSIEVDLSLIDHYDTLLTDVELTIARTAKIHDPHTFHRLRSVPGIGKILALVILYEIHHITRFPSVGDFISYCRLVKCAKL